MESFTTDPAPRGLPAPYPMRVVSRLTGLTSHTIRVWERRYSAVVPERTQGNARRFTDVDVARLKLLRQLTGQGYTISAVAQLDQLHLEELLDDPGLEEAAATPRGGASAHAALRGQFLDACSRYDGRDAREILSRVALWLPPRPLMFDFVLPVLEQLVEPKPSVAPVPHHRLARELLQGLLQAMQRMPVVGPEAGRILLAAPEGHHRELSLMIASSLAASRGLEILPLGNGVPEGELLDCIEGSGPDLVYLTVQRPMEKQELSLFADFVNRIGVRVETWLGLPAHHAARMVVDGVRFFDRFEDLDGALAARYPRTL